MINLESGTNSVWLSLRENLSSGATVSNNFKFVFQSDISATSWTFYPTDLTPSAKWSSFSIGVGVEQNLNTPRLNIPAGMYSYTITDNHSGTSLETGKVMVIENNEIAAVSRPAKTTIAVKR